MRIHGLYAFIAGGILAAAASSAAQADAVADFYKGKTMTLVVSTGAGGTYDTVARTIAKHMPNHIPGKPVIIVKYMPGAGHVLATNFMYNQAPKDGTHIATIGNSIPLHQILDGKGVRYDARKFNWLGTTGISNLMTVAWAASGIKSIDDVMKKEVTAGSTGTGSGTSLYPTVTNNVLGTKFKLIAGYRKATEIDLAMERGEVVVRSGFSYGSLSHEHPDWLKDKKVNFLFQVGGEREEDLPSVPLMTDLAKNDEQRQILKLISSTVAIGRPYLTTPGVPADRLAALRSAFMATVKDPAFLTDAKKLDFDLKPLGAEKVTEIVKDTINTPADIVTKARAAMEGAG
jgi:tripartite-type tricarboxylate transporter receptor subunit TctC